MEGLPETAAPGRTATHRQPSAPGAEPVPWARTAADLLTLSRLAVGVGLALWPWQPSLRSLAALFRWKMALWTADAADGALARWSRTPPSWIGRKVHPACPPGRTSLIRIDKSWKRCSILHNEP